MSPLGFQNHGNTCYLNASLQALLGLPMLVTDALNLKYILDKKVRLLGHQGKQVKLVQPFCQLAQVGLLFNIIFWNISQYFW